jgi:hypothetical protein
MPLGAYARDIGNGRTARGRRAGLVDLAIEIPAELHARFKAVSSGRRTTMRDAILAFLEAEVTEPDPQLTELLHVRVSPAFKRDLVESARQMRLTLTDLLVEAFGLLERRRDPVDMGVKKDFERMRGDRREPKLAGQRVRENRLRGSLPSAE